MGLSRSGISNHVPCVSMLSFPVLLPHSPTGVSWYNLPNKRLALKSFSQSLLLRVPSSTLMHNSSRNN